MEMVWSVYWVQYVVWAIVMVQWFCVAPNSGGTTPLGLNSSGTVVWCGVAPLQ